MSEEGFGLQLWGAAFQAASFLCLMAIPWIDGKVRLLVSIVAAIGFLAILSFQFYIGYAEQDYGLAFDLMTVTVASIFLYFLGSWLVERLFRLYLLSRQGKRPPPPSS
jgi:uncharacterized membrane protein